jgi:hypothetical protein
MMAEEIKMDADALWREEVYTDQRVGTIRVLTPVTRDGGPDQTRKVQYVGQASIYTPAGALPVNFELDGPTLSDACTQFAEAAQKAVEGFRFPRRQSWISAYSAAAWSARPWDLG